MTQHTVGHALAKPWMQRRAYRRQQIESIGKTEPQTGIFLSVGSAMLDAEAHLI